MAGLDELQGIIEKVAANVGPQVVRVGGGWRGGSGVVAADGMVLTNAHNVRGEEADVTFSDGRSTAGRVAGTDSDGDIAAISVDTGQIMALEWASEGTVGIGSAVFAVTASGQGSRVTFGLVSSVAREFRGPRGRRISGSIEHTAPMAPGSSGSALVDREGRLVGLNTNRVDGGLYLALPADAALKASFEAVARGESPTRPRLGIGIAPGRVARRMRRAVGLPERSGLLVRAVEDDSPAGRGGVESGDLLVAAGGRELDGIDALHLALDGLAAGSALELSVVRGTDERSVTVEFGAATADEQVG